jgi:transposase-like protein
MNPIQVESRQAPLGRVDDEAAERHSQVSPLLVQPPLLVPRDTQLLFASRQIDQEPRLRLAGEHLLGISDPGVQLMPGDQVLGLLDDPADVAFAGFRFPPDVIVVAVRWYLRFGLSYRDVEELLAERGVEVDHVTVYRWVQRFTPLLAEAARPCRHAVGDRWFVDETYVKVAGRWRYVYRAIDQFGQVIDVFLSARRDTMAAHRFFRRAIGTTKVAPVEVVTDRAATYPMVLEELLPAAWHRNDPAATQR